MASHELECPRCGKPEILLGHGSSHRVQRHADDHGPQARCDECGLVVDVEMEDYDPNDGASYRVVANLPDTAAAAKADAMEALARAEMVCGPIPPEIASGEVERFVAKVVAGTGVEP